MRVLSSVLVMHKLHPSESSDQCTCTKRIQARSSAFDGLVYL